MTRRAAHLVALAMAAPALGQGGIKQWLDPTADASLRLTDPDGLVLPGAAPPELLHVSFAGWSPTDPVNNPFSGAVISGQNAHVVRITVTFRGVVAPPGTLGLGGLDFAPFEYGDSPAYGFLDIDVDADVDTGGELGSGATQRYLANVARFGRVPGGPTAARTPLTDEQIDGDFTSGPQFERTGADFALVMCGCWPVTVVQEGGDADGVFEAGESWIVRGRFLERTRGYEGASFAYGGSDFFLYDPEIDVRFSHSVASNSTTVTVVFPLDMAGAALLAGEPEQDIDFDVSNHVSVVEALNDVVVASEFGLTGPTKVLAEKWIGRDPFDFLDPTTWNATALFGMAYADEADALFAWTDTGLAEVPADIDGDGAADADDRASIVATVYALDGGPDDLDGTVNGVVVLPQPGFDVHDIDGDGEIRMLDLYAYGDPADLNDDGKVDLLDFVVFQTLVHSGDESADFNLDQKIDVFDFIAFQTAAFH